jgi:hypothetical protein
MNARGGGDLKVFISNRDNRCAECGEDLGHRAWITLVDEGRAMCLGCADLDHLVFLPAGDTALTRRARKHSGLSAVVLKWSRARKRYERQGLLVEEGALAQAEQECTADAAAREARRARAAERRAELDDAYLVRFAARVRELYPHCPRGREEQIAEHACRKYSGRVGRSTAAKSLDESAVHLAVLAHVRHTETAYDALLVRGCARDEARARVSDQVFTVLARWSQGNPEQPAMG